MSLRSTRALRGLVIGALVAAAGACGDEPLDSGGDDTGDVAFFDITDALGDTAPADVPLDTLPVDTLPPDTLPADTAPADTAPADTTPDPGPGDTQVADETSPPDLVPDNTPPVVATTTPAAGESNVAVPFVVTVTFAEPIAANTIAAQTVKLRNYNGQEEPTSLAVSDDNRTITITPQAAQYFRASPYTVWLAGGIISDLAGNKLVENFEFTFFTENYEDQDGYIQLARDYAPDLYVDTTQAGGFGHTRVPTKFDSDGDWNGGNNVTWMKTDATTLVPALYFSVAESYTHYFIHYLYVFPWVKPPTASSEHGNGTLGAMVVIEKGVDPAPERPISVTLYWKTKAVEENLVFVTEESGIVGDKGAAQYGDVTAVYPQATLFPNGRFQGYISPEYESCLWTHTQNPGFGARCVLNEGLKSTMTTLFFQFLGGAPTPIKKATNWPIQTSQLEGSPASIGYALIPTLSTFWPRRLQIGPDEPYGATFNYENPGRPGDGSKLPSKLTDPLADTDSSFGRPMWAWKHEPANGSVFGIGQGWIGVDPAYYVLYRHKKPDNALEDFDPSTGTGFSVTYCFNGFASVDVRGEDPLCP